jgi:hypothetical protein
MNFSFPLSDVSLEIGDKPPEIENILYEDGMFTIGQNEILVRMDQVGLLFIENGESIKIYPDSNCSQEALQRNISNWGLVGILHQRKNLNFHAAAVAWKGQGMMILGDSGAGKSSLTAALVLNGARFISDDIVVIDFKDRKPWIRPLENQLALRKGTIDQLPKVGHPAGINSFTGKQLFDFPYEKGLVPLTRIYWITPDEHQLISFNQLGGVEKFGVLRGEICAWEMLKGMPETEMDYLEKLLSISKEVTLTQVKRYQNSKIKDFIGAVIEDLEKGSESLNTDRIG